MVSSFRDIVALWRTPDELAAEIGVGIWAARKWPQRNYIPAEWWMPILETKVARNAGLTADKLAKMARAARSQ